ncbi:glycosyltransferase family 4 protein [uncultured Dubosiella sp.]|uniref:glycosyltransferase family 4 protein n=1 Tax=uncultured Dubosiella sp. TaxID=1937011 RepID=UPI00272C539B|nr:glycosyltransferase family 4 protein [uncultured Dubosiella sp.]
MKKIWCIPSNVKTNKYIELMQDAMQESGYYVYGSGRNLKKFFCDIIHLNWYEDIPNDKKYIYIYKLFFIYIMKLSGKRIVYTMHNKKPHDNKNKYSVKMMRHLLKLSDSIIIHSEISRDVIETNFKEIDLSKVKYIPHPNYINVYPPKKDYKNFHKHDNQFVVAFVGQVRPYKNVEIILDVANKLMYNPEITFLICGKCISDDYKEGLLKMISGNNVRIDFRFIEDDELDSLMQNIDILILPYSTETALNSAAVILAMSFGKSIISTNVGTIQDFGNLPGISYYDFPEDREEHEKILEEKILNFYKIWKNDREEFKKNGMDLKCIVERNNSKEIISKALKDVYL